MYLLNTNTQGENYIFSLPTNHGVKYEQKYDSIGDVQTLNEDVHSKQETAKPFAHSQRFDTPYSTHDSLKQNKCVG